MLSGPREISGCVPFAPALTTLPPPRAIERRYGNEISTGMPKKSEGFTCTGIVLRSTLTLAVVPPMSRASTSFAAVNFGEIRAAVNAKNRAGLDRIDGFGLGDAGNAAIDVADQKRACVAMDFAEIVFGLEQRGGQRAVGVGIDQGAIRASHVVRAFGDVAASQYGDGAEEMIGILLLHDLLNSNLLLGSAMSALQTDADAADSGFEQGADSIHDFGVGSAGVHADDIAFGKDAAHDDAALLFAVEVFFMAASDEQADARPAEVPQERWR